MAKESGRYIIGIDEVGRGALAGPVTVAALAVPVNSKFRINSDARRGRSPDQKRRGNLELRDSKKLSPKQREIWFEHIKSCLEIFYATASVSPKIIDRINISQAANAATARALKKLTVKIGVASINGSRIFFDGGLYVKSKEFKSLNKKTVIKGDEKIPAIALASIVAKVTRDNRMVVLGRKYLAYSFHAHKGYGTKKHFLEIKKSGASKIHRSTFLH